MTRIIYTSLLRSSPFVFVWLSLLVIPIGGISCLALSASAEPVNGVFGVTIAITADGIFNPRIQVAKIIKVAPELPAAKSGITVGDEVLEVDGQRIPSATASELAPLTKGKKVGELVTLVLAHPDGQHYTVKLIAVTRPRD